MNFSKRMRPPQALFFEVTAENDRKLAKEFDCPSSIWRMIAELSNVEFPRNGETASSKELYVKQCRCMLMEWMFSLMRLAKP